MEIWLSFLLNDWTGLAYLAIAAGSVGVGARLFLRQNRAVRPHGERPLTLFPDKLTMNVDAGSRVRSLTFYGVNASSSHVRIKSASVTSAIADACLPVEIEARRRGGETAASPLSGQNFALRTEPADSSVPPGARLVLTANFNAPLGLALDDFIAGWSQFSLDVEDEANRYQLAFNEKHLTVFLSGAKRLDAMAKAAASHK